jgi:uncharacterized protein YlxW (UPF0749 family)
LLQLREKLSEFQAENNLLGTLVKELKVTTNKWRSTGFNSSSMLCQLVTLQQGTMLLQLTLLQPGTSPIMLLQLPLLICCIIMWTATGLCVFQGEKDALQKRLASTVKQHADAASRAATAVQQVDAAGRDQKRLAAEVERLSSVVHSHSVRLQK